MAEHQLMSSCLFSETATSDFQLKSFRKPSRHGANRLDVGGSVLVVFRFKPDVKSDPLSITFSEPGQLLTLLI